jgi:hypothetical protein
MVLFEQQPSASRIAAPIVATGAQTLGRRRARSASSNVRRTSGARATDQRHANVPSVLSVPSVSTFCPKTEVFV